MESGAEDRERASSATNFANKARVVPNGGRREGSCCCCHPPAKIPPFVGWLEDEGNREQQFAVREREEVGEAAARGHKYLGDQRGENSQQHLALRISAAAAPGAHEAKTKAIRFAWVFFSCEMPHTRTELALLEA